MKHVFMLATAFFLSFGAQAEEKGFKKIFDGKTLSGWAGPLNSYQAVGGTIQCKPGKGGTIYTKEVYGDFVVRLEIKLPAGGNNGLAIRYPGKGNTAYAGMCELQVLDNASPKYAKLHPAQYHGSAYGMFAAKRGHLKKPGEWNTQEVTVKGSTIKVVLNGEKILDCDLSKVEKPMVKIGKFKGRTRTYGHFGFAGHGAAVQFRNVRIKDLFTPSSLKGVSRRIDDFNAVKFDSSQKGKRTINYWGNIILIKSVSLGSLKMKSSSDDLLYELTYFRNLIDGMSTRGVDQEAIRAAEALTSLYQKPLTQLELAKKNDPLDAVEGFTRGFLFGIPGILLTASDQAEKGRVANKDFMEAKGKVIVELRKIRNSLSKKYNKDFPVIIK